MVGQFTGPIVVLYGKETRFLGRGGVVDAVSVVRHAVGGFDRKSWHGLCSSHDEATPDAGAGQGQEIEGFVLVTVGASSSGQHVERRLIRSRF
jgi:hypothetical protein